MQAQHTMPVIPNTVKEYVNPIYLTGFSTTVIKRKGAIGSYTNSGSLLLLAQITTDVQRKKK